MAKRNRIAFIQAAHVPYIAETTNVEPKRPFTHIYTFIKNDQAMTRIAFKEVFDELRNYLNNQSLNYGILLTPDGTFVFTEDKVDFNPLMVKLATGINFGKQVNNARDELVIVNSGLGRKNASY